MTLWKKGLIILGIGIVASTILMSLGVGGFLREFSRLVSLVGIVVTVFGLIKRK